jgi:hypothetical protein
MQGEPDGEAEACTGGPQLLIRRKPLATSHASALLPKGVSNRGKSQHIVQKAGGESVSQLPLKDKAFLIFLGQNPPFELRRKLALRLQSFHEIHGGSSKCCPSISVSGGQQGWLAFAPKGKASARFRRFFPILSMGLGRQEESRYFSAST